jgi:hypothetical protein
MAKDVQVTGWVGWIYFAGFMLVLSGILQIISGLVALLNDGFYKTAQGTVIVFDFATWGWVHLLLGILVTCIGTALFSGHAWARIAAIILASLNMIAYFTFITAYPIWSIIIIVIDVFIIYALTVHGRELAEV